MMGDLICEPSNSGHFLQDRLMTTLIKPIAIIKFAVWFNGGEVFESLFE
jgi:hypothetical protein